MARRSLFQSATFYLAALIVFSFACARVPAAQPQRSPGTATALLAPTATAQPISTEALDTPQPTVAATPLGGGDQIVFASNRDGNWEIYRMRSDGTGVVRLTDSAASDWFPELAHNGQHLLFWSQPDEDTLDGVSLQWMLSDGSQQGTFAGGVSGYSAWSADDRWVAMTAWAEDGNLDIYRTDLQGQNLLQLTTDPAHDLHPDWSPDGNKIAFTSYRNDATHIYLMEADGSDQHRLTDDQQPEMEPAWSPDGRRLAYTVQEGDSTNIYLVNADGTDASPLTNETGFYNENPTWSPDGSMIIFWSNRTGNSELFAIRLDGTGLINLTNNPAEDQNPSWSQ